MLGNLRRLEFCSQGNEIVGWNKCRICNLKLWDQYSVKMLRKTGTEVVNKEGWENIKE